MSSSAPKERISPMMGHAIIGTATAADTLKGILEALIGIPILGEGTEVLGDVVGWSTDIGLCIWFVALGVSPMEGGFRSPAFTLFGAALGDALPLVNIAPFDDIAAITIVKAVQKKDRAAMTAANAANDNERGSMAQAA